LKIEFVTDITLNNFSDTFLCGSSNIQFGSTSLNANGTRPLINVTAIDYQGLIQNGVSSTGYNDIYVYNLNVICTEQYSDSVGLIGGQDFANGAINNFIVNCTASGLMPNATPGCGGIVGAFAGSNGGNLQIIGCSFTGASIGQNGGGIVGERAGDNGGSVTCRKCWSTGNILNLGGGIFGKDSENAQAIDCFSTGSMTQEAGGIFGSNASFNGGTTLAQNCYSLGTIETNSGGIFGSNAASSGGAAIATASNCYSAGTFSGGGGFGIFGTGSTGSVTSDCYTADGAWDTFVAIANLTGVPISPSIVGTTWVATVVNQPFELANFGYTPFTLNVIDPVTSSLIQTASKTSIVGQSSSPAIVSGKAYTILESSEVTPTVTLDPNTGSFLSPNEGTFTFVVRNNGSYNITNVTLTVTSSPITSSSSSKKRRFGILEISIAILIARILYKRFCIPFPVALALVFAAGIYF
jgi:hypothetical protein